MKKVILLGGGGHAKCVIDAMTLSGKFNLAGIVDVKAKAGRDILGVPVIGSDPDLPRIFRRGIKFCFICMGSVGDPASRIRLWKAAVSAGFAFPNVIHHSAMVSRHSSIGNGVYIGPGAIVNADAVVGDNCIINSGAIVEHDCRIGDFVHIAPGAVLSAGVEVGHRAHIGTGCAVIQYVNIGDDAMIGAGSVVVKGIPARSVCFGNPAKKTRRLVC